MNTLIKELNVMISRILWMIVGYLSIVKDTWIEERKNVGKKWEKD
jgi:hypothetical protein